MRGATSRDRDGRNLIPPLTPGERVRLSACGVWCLIAWPVKGELPDNMTRRSCYTRKITDMSIGTVVRLGERNGVINVVVQWDEAVTQQAYAPRFLTRVDSSCVAALPGVP